eukprot:TRINITY_DN5715_c0_g2_i1.p1 TRINITY_DN5715_c0_g2~~TRINITY_DN5715_c0_g2_i1.p1  ORF type:complete len:203 (-),score=45.68 TRINITY_DN5715_c0_g2_i1:138-707(-)
MGKIRKELIEIIEAERASKLQLIDKMQSHTQEWSQVADKVEEALDEASKLEMEATDKKSNIEFAEKELLAATEKLKNLKKISDEQLKEMRTENETLRELLAKKRSEALAVARKNTGNAVDAEQEVRHIYEAIEEAKAELNALAAENKKLQRKQNAGSIHKNSNEVQVSCDLLIDLNYSKEHLRAGAHRL